MLTTVASSAPGQLAQQVSDDVVTIAAPRPFQIEFQGHRIPHRGSCGFNCGIGDERAAKIRVQNRARQIIDRPKPRTLVALQTSKCDCCGALRVDQAIAVIACGRKRCANGADERLASKAIKGSRCSTGPQYRVDGRQASQVGWRH